MSLDDVELHLIESLDDVSRFISWLGQVRDGEFLSFDTETTGLSQENDYVRLCQIGDAVHGWAFQWDRWSGIMKDVASKYTGTFVAHNAPFDWGMLHKEGVTIPRGRIHDTRMMCHIIDPTYSTALKENAIRYVDPRAKNLQTDFSGTSWTWETVPIEYEPYWTYGALDPVITQQLHNHLWPKIHGQPHEKAFEIDNAVQWVTWDMSRNGTPIDITYAQEHYDKFTQHCDTIKTWCKDEYGVDPGRNQQVIARLAKDGVEFHKTTAQGAVSLDKDVLEGIEHPLARQVLQRRRLEKLASTYLRHFIAGTDANGFIHPSINTLGARTSRMSMSDPNMQNLPRKVEDNPPARAVRNCICAQLGYTLIFCDFSQIEMRILAFLAMDVNMIKAFTSPGDFFVNMARQVYADPTIEKDDPRRSGVKNLGYAKIYGAGLAKMAWTAGVSIEVIKAVMGDFDTEFYGVRTFQDQTMAAAMQHKSQEGQAYGVCPLTGRRQPAAPGKEYGLVNSLIQGAAASLFKMKLLELDQAGLGDWMVLPVHDEVILHVPNEHVVDVVETLHKVMNDMTIIAPVPVTAEVSFGQRWGVKMDWNEELWRTNEWRI